MASLLIVPVACIPIGAMIVYLDHASMDTNDPPLPPSLAFGGMVAPALAGVIVATRLLKHFPRDPSAIYAGRVLAIIGAALAWGWLIFTIPIGALGWMLSGFRG